MRLFLILGLVLCSYIVSYGQASFKLSGLVVDEKGVPLPGATIVVKPKQYACSTNRDGMFLLQNISKGDYLITVDFIGYQSNTDSVHLDDDLFLTIQLIEQHHELNEVVIRENYEQSKNRLQTLNVEAVGSEFMLQNNSTNLVKMLDKLPGVSSMDIGSGFSKPVIRGLGFNRIVLSEFGIKQEGQQWGADHGLEIDQYNVDKLLVHKGPLSLQFGSDAIGGVIEVVSPILPQDNAVFGDVNLIAKSNNRSYGYSAMVGFRKDVWVFRGRVTQNFFGDYRVPTDTFVYLTRSMPIYDNILVNTAGNETNVASSIGYIGKEFQSELNVSNVYQKVGFFPGAHGVPSEERVQPDGNNRNIAMPFSNVNHLKVVSNSVFELLDGSIKVDLGYQNNHRQEWALFHTHYGNLTPPSEDPNLELDFDLDTYNANVKYISKVDKQWHTVVGLSSDYQENRVGGYNFLLPEYDRATFGAYGIETFRLNENLSIVAGVRFDVGLLDIAAYKDTILMNYLMDMGNYTPEEINYYSQRSFGVDRNIGDLSWSGGAIYQFNNEQLFKVNVGHSFRMPGANELAANGVHHGTFRHEQGDPTLDSEKSYQLDLDYSFQNDIIFLGVNPFATYFTNYIFLNPTGEWSLLPHSGQIYRYQQAEALFFGGEMTFNYKFAKGFVFESALEYVLMHNLTDGYPLPFAPPLSLLNGLTYHIHQGFPAVEDFHITFEHRWVADQNRISRNEEATSGYTTFAISATSSFKFRDFVCDLSLQVQNLFDTNYLNHLSFYRQLNIPEPGRNTQIILKVPF